MNVRRYFGLTAREAMQRVRDELGDEAVVLKNRQVDGGVEILALAADALPPSDEAPVAPSAPNRAPGAMSTVLFEAYVRERQQRRREQEAKANQMKAFAASPEATNSGSVVLSRDPLPRTAPRADGPALGTPSGAQPIVDRIDRIDGASSRPVRTIRRDRADAASNDEVIDARSVLTELRQLRGSLSHQIESISWFEGVRRNPAQSRLLRQLLQMGFSASLSRMIADNVPANMDAHKASQWLRDVIVRNLRADEPEQSLFDEGGTFALLGPTGVGKTTTAAKIAAQFALKHGAQSVGLITADVYRIGAQDQLKTFGRMLGVPVHVAHDVGALADFLQLFMNRKLVLIDTAGLGQRDERVNELLTALSATTVRKVLVLNAATQPEGIEEVIGAYRGRESAGVVLSKVDETVRLGGAIDCMIRHRLRLVGIANGQRVPEDWHRADVRALAQRALASFDPDASNPFSFEESELAMLASGARQSNRTSELRGV